MRTAAFSILLSFVLAAPAFASPSKLICNDGALTAEPRAGYYKEYVVTIHDPGVVEHFIKESKSVVHGRDEYYNRPATFQKRFPWMVQEIIQDGKRKLQIVDFKFYPHDNGFSTSGPAGAVLEWAGSGMDLVVRGSYMPSSHSNIVYEIAHWYFERCELR